MDVSVNWVSIADTPKPPCDRPERGRGEVWHIPAAEIQVGEPVQLLKATRGGRVDLPLFEYQCHDNEMHVIGYAMQLAAAALAAAPRGDILRLHLSLGDQAETVSCAWGIALRFWVGLGIVMRKSDG